MVSSLASLPLGSSGRTDWETPDPLFQELDREFRFTLDACASPSNTKCPRYFTIADNALVQYWGGAGSSVWCNPPYGKGIGDWMEKAYEESRLGAVVVCLVFARTDTKWWHDWVMDKASEIRFIKGRIRFKGASSSAPFPSVLVIYRPPL